MDLFDPEWCTEFVEACASGEPVLRDTVVEVQLSGAPRGKGRVTLTIEDGRVQSCEARKADEADLRLKSSWEDVWAMLQGELDPNVAYMTGDLKTDGPTGPLLVLLAAYRRPGAVAARGDLAARTVPTGD